jgi:predicted small metal-binding protein
MNKVLKCNDLNPGCSFEARGNTDEDVLKKAAEHTKTVHKMHEIPPDVLDKARSAIRDESKARGQNGGDGITSKRSDGGTQSRRPWNHHGPRVSASPLPLGASGSGVVSRALLHCFPLRYVQSSNDTGDAGDGEDIRNAELSPRRGIGGREKR